MVHCLPLCIFLLYMSMVPCTASQLYLLKHFEGPTLFTMGHIYYSWCTWKMLLSGLKCQVKAWCHFIQEQFKFELWKWRRMPKICIFFPPPNLFIILICSGFCFMLNSFILLLLCEREKKTTFWNSLSSASLTNGGKRGKTNRSLSKQNNFSSIY